MIMSKALTEIFKHNLWANLRVIDVCEKLSEEQLEAALPGTYGSIKATLAHLCRAEEGYVFRLTGEKPEKPLREIEGFPSFGALREGALRSGGRLIRVVSGDEPIENIVSNFEDGTFAIAPAQFLLQAINHATEHRTHILAILGSLGIELPENEGVDGWAYGETGNEPLVVRLTQHE
jgi:uncharacterized damage-inducible protein DinB